MRAMSALTWLMAFSVSMNFSYEMRVGVRELWNLVEGAGGSAYL